MSQARRIYFGKILADLSSQAFHGYFDHAEDYNEGTGTYQDTGSRDKPVIFVINTAHFRFLYNTRTHGYEFQRMPEGTRIIEGWDGLSSSQHTAFVSELYGFMYHNRMIDGSHRDYVEELCIAPSRAS